MRILSNASVIVILSFTLLGMTICKERDCLNDFLRNQPYTVVGTVKVKMGQLDSLMNKIYDIKRLDYDSLKSIPRQTTSVNLYNKLHKLAGNTVTEHISVPQIQKIVSRYLIQEGAVKLSDYRFLFTVSLLKDGSIFRIQFMTPGNIILTVEDCADLFKSLNDAHIFVPWKEDISDMSITIPFRFD